ncbi:hypothetical protein [Parafrigoribacterium soli]|uniref:hypothetical protein n=1 Tax=Parafrigoribacterium soli TaxID=3144663 RepID=UPI0032F01E21
MVDRCDAELPGATIVAQYAAMSAEPDAAVTSEVYAVEVASTPPCAYAVHRPTAAGPVASGPTGAAVGVSVGLGVDVDVASALASVLTSVLTSVSRVSGAGAPTRSCAPC